MVPHWVRGAKEQCKIVSTKDKKVTPLSICALGGSVATNQAGINAEVIEVKSFEELKALGTEKIKGKIVFYNVFMDLTNISTGRSYGQSVKYRWGGASEAAKYGAVASITRSMTMATNDFPHTGAMGYDSLVPIKIPAAAISAKGANELVEILKNDPKAKIFIKMNCETLKDEPSFSVVGEIKGSDKANEVILCGGHLDSWDTGEGAHDDGTGVVATIEVLAAFKKIGIKPRRTIRAVAFMNEENGTRGAKSYADLTKAQGLKHIAALESDGGGHTPRGLGIDGGIDTIKYFQAWQPLFEPYDVKIKRGGGGSDIEPLQAHGAIMMSLEADSQRYFDFHHTPDDIFEHVHKRELELGAAAITSLIYLIDKYGVPQK